MLVLLGGEYVVWDKAATIRFKRPGTGTLSATFEIPDAELDAIRCALENRDSIDREYTVDLVDDDRVVHATAEKTIHISTDDDKRT